MPTRRSTLMGLVAAAAPYRLLAQAADEDKWIEDALLTLVFGSSVDIPPALRFLTERGASGRRQRADLRPHVQPL